jgi:hypothetical protein
MTKPATIHARGGDIVLYRAKNGRPALDVRLEQNTLWLSLNQMAALFDRDKSVVSRHLRNVFATKELDRKSVVAHFATTADDGKTYHVDFYNLDAILSVGYAGPTGRVPVPTEKRFLINLAVSQLFRRA